MSALLEYRARSSQGYDLHVHKLCSAPLPDASLHAKFQNQRPSGSREDFLKVFAIYSHGGHLGHVTWTIYMYELSAKNKGENVSCSITKHGTPANPDRHYH